jgi:hypothetical protein
MGKKNKLELTNIQLESGFCSGSGCVISSKYIANSFFDFRGIRRVICKPFNEQ